MNQVPLHKESQDQTGHQTFYWYYHYHYFYYFLLLLLFIIININFVVFVLCIRCCSTTWGGVRGTWSASCPKRRRPASARASSGCTSSTTPIRIGASSGRSSLSRLPGLCARWRTAGGSARDRQPQGWAYAVARWQYILCFAVYDDDDDDDDDN